MKIRTLIRIYKRLLPLYEKSIKTGVIPNNLRWGLCTALHHLVIQTHFTWKTYEEFIRIHSRCRDYYYSNYYRGLESNYLFTPPCLCPNPNAAIEISIIPRRDFLIEEIADLQRLLKEGYTDV